jgi:hypothetical protein
MLPPLYFDQQEQITMPETEFHLRPSFARTAAADIFGKLDAELNAIRIDSETLVELHKMANEYGVSISELCRTTLRVRAWGEEHVRTLNAQHMARVMGNAGTLRGTTV